MGIFVVNLEFFRKCTIQRAKMLPSVHQDTPFEPSRSTIKFVFKLFTIRGDHFDLEGSEQSKKVHSDLVHPRDEQKLF